MTFGYRSSRGGFRSPRGSSSRGGSFRARGRGSDNFFRPSRGSSFRGRSSFRGGSSRFDDMDDHYESRSSGSKYSHDRYGSSHSRKDDDFHHRRDTHSRDSSSGSFSRDHPRRSDFEPERKRMKSESSYKEGASPRRSYPYDDMENSSRNYNSSSSSYHSDSSPFKSHKKDYGDFKKPLPLDREFSSRRPTRGIRARGGISRTMTKTIRPLMAGSLKRVGVGRVSKASMASRLQLLLRKKKQLRIQRLRRAREEQERVDDDSKHEDEGDIVLSEEEEDLADDDVANEDDEEPKSSPESKKVVMKETKKEPKDEPDTDDAAESPKTKEKPSPMSRFHRQHITLKCIHCKAEYPTFKVYLRHLQQFRHKKSMETVVFRLRKKLSKMRVDQREQQRIVDEQCEDSARTSYCKLCKLNYKQTRQEHLTSDFHMSMSEFLNPKCSPCDMRFQTPILYEHHRCTLAHIKRKAQLAAKKTDHEEFGGDEDNGEEGFMVLDSVGSAEESNNENEDADLSKDEDKQALKKKKDASKNVGNEYIKKVMCYYCKLCRLCLRYNSKVSQDVLLLAHCRSRFHLKRYSEEMAKKQAREKSAGEKEVKTESISMNETEASDPEESNETLWIDENGEDPKMSEDEEDSKSTIRYDRFGHSEEKESIDKQKTSMEADITDASKGEKSSD